MEHGRGSRSDAFVDCCDGNATARRTQRRGSNTELRNGKVDRPKSVWRNSSERLVRIWWSKLGCRRSGLQPVQCRLDCRSLSTALICRVNSTQTSGRKNATLFRLSVRFPGRFLRPFLLRYRESTHGGPKSNQNSSSRLRSALGNSELPFLEMFCMDPRPWFLSSSLFRGLMLINGWLHGYNTRRSRATASDNL